MDSPSQSTHQTHKNSVKPQLIANSSKIFKYVKELICPKNRSTFNQRSTIIFESVSEILENQDQIESLAGITRFIMSVIILGHLHLYHPFNQIIFKTITKVYKKCQQTSNQLQYYIHPETEEEHQYLVDQLQKNNYKIQLCGEFIYLVAQWFPCDFINESQESIYSQTCKQLIKDPNLIQHKIYDGRYLFQLQKKLESLNLNKGHFCGLCSQIVEQLVRNKGKGKSKRKKQQTLETKENEQKYINTEYKQSTGVEKQIKVDAKMEQDQRKIIDKIRHRISSRKQLEHYKEGQVPTVSQTVNMRSNKLISIANQDIKSLSPEITKSKSQNFMIPQHGRNKRISRIPRTKKTISNLRYQKPLNYAASYSTAYSSNNYLSSPKVFSSFKTEGSLNFKIQMGKRCTHEATVSFLSEEFSNFKYKIYKNIVKVKYNRETPVDIVSPSAESLIKHNREKGYFLVDLSIKFQIVVTDMTGPAERRKELTLPIGYIKLINSINSAQWEIQKTKLVERMFLPDPRLCRNVKQLSEILKMKQQRSTYCKSSKSPQKHSLVGQINKYKFKLYATQISDNKIFLQCWCPQEKVKLFNGLLEEIIFCFGSA